MLQKETKAAQAATKEPRKPSEQSEHSNPAAEIKSPFLDKLGAAQFLGVSVRCLEVWMKKRLVVYSRIGRTIRFSPDELEDHVRTKCRVV